MSTIAARRCPLCRRTISSDPIRTDDGAACGVCRRTVPRTLPAAPETEDAEDAAAPVFSPPPQAWSTTIVVAEILPSGERRDTTVPGAGPYRTPPGAGPGLWIGWTEDRSWVWLFLGVFTVVGAAGLVAGWMWHPYDRGMWVFSAVLLLCPWLMFMMWNNHGFVHADHEGLRWQDGRVVRRLSADDIAQLFVRDTTEPNDGEGIPSPSFTVYARDRSGRDHSLVSFESPRQARWLEHRIEHYLGIVDRPIDGELPRGA